MDGENFCDRVLSRVRHATPEERNDIRAELLGHLEDHAEALKDAGYDEETAGERALSAMGEPEQIGEELNRNYPLGWLILSRVTLAASIFLAVSVLLYWPLLGSTFNSFQARIDPEGAERYHSAIEDSAHAREVNLKARIGNDVLYIYQVSLVPAADGQTGTVSIAMCNYDRNPFGMASGAALGALQLETESGRLVKYPSGGGGDSGAYYSVMKDIPVTRQDGYLAVSYDRYGSHVRLEVPLDWEGSK